MKKTFLLILVIVHSLATVYAQNVNTTIFTIFTTAGCGCTGSGGAPLTFTTHEEVIDQLQAATTGIEFLVWQGSRQAAVEELESNRENYDGVIIIGEIDFGDFGIAFTGLPTIFVHNLWEFMTSPYNLFLTGKIPEGSILAGGDDQRYRNRKILTAQLDRRNVCSPEVKESMFNDLVDKIKLIRVVKEVKGTRILMLTADKNDVIARVNYRGDISQQFPDDHNDRYVKNLKELFDIDIVRVGGEEFYEAFKNADVGQAVQIADKWIRGARKVTASRDEIVKSARAYLATDALRIKYDCNAVSTHLRSVTGSGELKDRFNPGIGMELGFKPRGIMGVCQNYPDLLVAQVLAYALTGRPSMMGDFIYDIDNGVEIILHCGIPVNPFGGDNMIPYSIVPHAESPVRDIPERPGSSTGLTAEWPQGEPVTIWEIHSLHREIRLHTGKIVDGHAIYTGGENIDDVMCTAKIFARVDAKKLRDNHFFPSKYGIHTNATLGDLRKQLTDISVFLGIAVNDSDI